MNHSFLLFSLFVLLFSCGQPEAGSSRQAVAGLESGHQPRPNIILILADDMGYSDPGFMGSEIQTPNLDRLAGNGLVCTQFYNAGRCCPTRASLMTGLYQHQVGVGEMTGDRGHDSYRGALNHKGATLAELLKPAGYATMMSGKWHLGSKEGQRPNDRGFDRFFGIPEGGGVYYFPFRKPRSVMLDRKPAQVDSATFYTTEAFSQYATSFILEHRDTSERPFFLYLPHIAPHFPLQAPDSAIEQYLGQYKAGFSEIRKRRFEAMKTRGILTSAHQLSLPDSEVLEWESLNPEEQACFDRRMAVYAAQLGLMDQGIGQLIQTLEELEILDETVILFLTDNGATHERLEEPEDCAVIGTRHSNPTVSRSWANVSNVPFRMYKHWVHEGGIATPLLVHYPRLISQGRISRNPGHIIDIVPTCLELAGAPYPESLLPLEGNSLIPVLTNTAAVEERILAWEHRGNRALRKGNFKLVSAFPENKWHLYDLSADPSELQDLTAGMPAKVSELEAEYEQWAARIGVVSWEELKK